MSTPPFIFVNSADYPGAQMFTLAHELAHIWLGTSASFDLHDFQPANNQLERACNKIAAELLVPTQAITKHWDEFNVSDDVYRAIARHFKVSKIVAARRALDAGCISQVQFDVFYRDYKRGYEDWKAAEKQKKKPARVPPDKTIPAYISPRFMDILTTAVGEGRTLYREAYALTHTTPKTFDAIKKRIEDEGAAQLTSRYLLDANVFIEPSKKYYAMDLVPRYWNCLKTYAQKGIISSIDPPSEG